MDAVAQHVAENWKAYAVLLACLVPTLVIFRKFTVPAMVWAIEWVMYCGLFHVAVNVFVRIVRWFQYNTQMEMREEERVYKDWATPLVDFWNRDGYRPGWIFWLELAVAVVFLLAMIRYRPMTVQKVRSRKPALTKGVGPAQNLITKYRNKR
jgi:hypothetical protein